jgi:UDP-glucose 4-epimerase
MSSKPVAVVTGGAGFIGSHMVDLLLNEGYSVRVIDNLHGGRLQNLDHVRAHSSLAVEVRDIRDLKPEDTLFKDAKYVFHFAGIGDIVPSIDKPIDYMSTNVMGTVHVLECSRYAKVEKFVYAASSSCFGLANQLPTPEDATIQPEYPYAFSKYLGEQSALHWQQIYSLPVNCIRMFNVYGPRSKTTGAYGAVFGVFLAQKLKNMPFTVVGDGTQTRDFVFVTDVAKAFLQTAKVARSGEVYNLGAGNPQSVNRLIELLGGEVTYVPKRPGEPDCTWADISKIQRDIGWTPECSFEHGVQQMLANIDYWREAPVWNPDSIREATRGWFEAFSRKGELQ